MAGVMLLGAARFVVTEGLAEGGAVFLTRSERAASLRG